ncbi:MAG: dihydrolipoyl dehydrogenase [Dehalococcoidia bacterium]|nr:dihydrolipoyl dehydrogenase [Dehalococcoidia bacterium]
MSAVTFDIAVIGGGPAGYGAATQASKLGAHVVLIEKESLGGTCLNHGCIPTKTLLHSLNILRSLKESARFGIVGNESSLDIDKLKERRDEVISILHDSMAQLLEEHQIKRITGKASFKSPYDIEIQTSDNTSMRLRADKIIIASGSVPRQLNVPDGDNPHILYSNDLLKLKAIPSKLIIIGGGAVGLEMATIMHRAGSQVSIVEIAPYILPNEDSEITSVLELALKRNGMQIYTNSTMQNIECGINSVKITFSQAGIETKLEAESICVCIGQQPETSLLGLESAGVSYDTYGVKVDAYMRTSAPHIYAAGDVTGMNMLAYVAAAQGRVAAANATGHNEVMEYAAIPRCVFTAPEVASVGLNENAAASLGIKTKILRSSMASNPYATILGERRGMVKLIVEDISGKLLGAQIVGSGTVSLISECALAIKLGATARDIAYTLHPHPSLAEALQEAALTIDYP